MKDLENKSRSVIARHDVMSQRPGCLIIIAFDCNKNNNNKIRKRISIKKGRKLPLRLTSREGIPLMKKTKVSHRLQEESSSPSMLFMASSSLKDHHQHYMSLVSITVKPVLL
jgi:hypothetical protein